MDSPGMQDIATGNLAAGYAHFIVRAPLVMVGDNEKRTTENGIKMSKPVSTSLYTFVIVFYKTIF